MSSGAWPHPVPIPKGWTPDDLDDWEERSAILEVDGGLDRDTAERQATEEIEKRRQGHAVGRERGQRSK